MNYLDLTLPTPAHNLACDEFLLDACDAHDFPDVLRFWESSSYFVVVGYANKVDTEVKRAACEDQGVPVLRRCSGGGTVVQGRGCLNYALIFNLSRHPACQTITQTNHYVMERHRELFQKLLGTKVEIHGHTDLARHADGSVRKFSGNAQRRKKNALLFHGTFLLDFDISLISSILKMPSIQPNYRENRAHGKFLANLNRPSAAIKSLLREGWDAQESLQMDLKLPEALRLKYEGSDWNHKF